MFDFFVCFAIIYSTRQSVGERNSPDPAKYIARNSRLLFQEQDGYFLCLDSM